jgi:hypothetical protein
MNKKNNSRTQWILKFKVKSYSKNKIKTNDFISSIGQYV